MRWKGEDYMVRIAGVDLPEQKRVDIGLTYIFGIGRSNVVKVLKESGVDGSIRIKDLTDEEVGKLQRSVDQFKLEGDLRGEIAANIKRMEDIGSYRGLRHRRGLPVRGQRTRSNARTRRGKRKTIGAISKETQSKTGPTEVKKEENK